MNRALEQARFKRARELREKGWHTARAHLALARVADATTFVRDGATLSEGWAQVDHYGRITVDPYRLGESDEWAWVFTHLLLHLGLGHADPDQLPELEKGSAYPVACCVATNRFAEVLKVGRSLVRMPDLPGGDELALAERWRTVGIPAELRGLGTAASKPCFAVGEPPRWSDRDSPRWTDLFAQGLANAATGAMESAARARGQVILGKQMQAWDHALAWFVSSYPLLGAIASALTIVDDAELARGWDITIAAVNAEVGEIYINPNAPLSSEEWRFVLAHEMLHAALGHGRRIDGRDPYLWNVACDYVINAWLVEMNVGVMPEDSLYDARLVGLSAESVYDTLVTDLRRARRLTTYGGRKVGDILGDWHSEPDAAHRRASRRCEPAPLPPWRQGDRVGAVNLDEFYRRALTTGLEYHDRSRGLVPAGLVAEIRALDHPPLPWDARLARWFDEHIRTPEPRRSYARPSRRQQATPDIPRPGRYLPAELVSRATFGVVLDTSGSMNRELLGKALGAIASYAAARDVPAARVVFCDAAAYDAGYLPIEDIAGRVRVRGRGGTVLQPGIHLLERADDFPADGPILVITDAQCDVVRIRRDHAFLIPAGASLPFTARGPVFRVQ